MSKPRTKPLKHEPREIELQAARINELEEEVAGLRGLLIIDEEQRALAGKDRVTLSGGDEDTSDEQKPGNARGSG